MIPQDDRAIVADVMLESDPRPMPPEVQRAYRSPLDLLALLRSHVYSKEDRLQIREQMLEELLSRFGESEVFVGKSGKTQRVSARVKSFRSDWVSSIDFMIKLEQYGGPEITLPILARLMEPQWQRWWSTFRERDKRFASYKYQTWVEVAELVLGERQVRWVAAQIAREKLVGASARDEQAALPVIEAVEQYVQAPSEDLRKKMLDKQYALGRYLLGEKELYDAQRLTATYAGRGDLWKAMSKTSAVVEKVLAAAAPDYQLAYIPDLFSNIPMGMTWMKEDFKRFFTPTLITEVGRSSRRD